MQSPGALHRTDHIAAALRDHAGDSAKSIRIVQQLIITFKKATVDEAVGLDTRKRQGEFVLLLVAGKGCIGE